MKRSCIRSVVQRAHKAALLSLSAALLIAIPVGSSSAQEFRPLFDGKTLEGWTGDTELWSVQDGVIVGTTDEKQIRRNTFLVADGEFHNFVLKAKFKLRNHNSGIQFRATKGENFSVSGYQADIAAQRYTGILYDEGTGRGILADVKPEEINEFYKAGDWNEYEITARDDKITIKLNGKVTIEFTETEAERATAKGVIALQLHTGENMRVEYKEIELQELEDE